MVAGAARLSLLQAWSAGAEIADEEGATLRRLYRDGDRWVGVLGFPVEDRDGRRVRPVKHFDVGGVLRG